MIRGEKSLNRLSTVTTKTWIVAGLSFIPLALAPLGTWARICLFLVGLTALALAGKGAKFGLFLAVLTPVLMMSFLIQAVSYGGESVLASWQPKEGLRFAVTEQGIHFGFLLALQILCFGTGCTLISLTTTSWGLRSALTSWRVPARIIYLLVASLNAPTQLSRYVAIAGESSWARGLEKAGWRNKLRLASRRATTIFTLILLDQESRARSLAQRRLEESGRRIFLKTEDDSILQKIVRWMLPCISIALIVLAFGGAL